MLNTHADILILGTGDAATAMSRYVREAGLQALIVADRLPGCGDIAVVSDGRLPAVLHDHIERICLTETPIRLYSACAEYTCNSLVIAIGEPGKHEPVPCDGPLLSQGPQRIHELAWVGDDRNAVDQALRFAGGAGKVSIILRRASDRCRWIFHRYLRQMHDQVRMRMGDAQIKFPVH
jgi:thioredoxin reductase